MPMMFQKNGIYFWNYCGPKLPLRYGIHYISSSTKLLWLIYLHTTTMTLVTQQVLDPICHILEVINVHNFISDGNPHVISTLGHARDFGKCYEHWGSLGDVFIIFLDTSVLAYLCVFFKYTKWRFYIEFCSCYVFWNPNMFDQPMFHFTNITHNHYGMFLLRLSVFWHHRCNTLDSGEWWNDKCFFWRSELNSSRMTYKFNECGMYESTGRFVWLYYVYKVTF